MSEFSGKTAIVTGGARGMGREYVRLLADAGANVVIADVNSSVAQQTIEDLNAGNAVRFVHTDVGSIEVGQTRLLAIVEPTELRTSVTFSVRDANGVRRFCAEVGRLYPAKPDSKPKPAEITELVR